MIITKEVEIKVTKHNIMLYRKLYRIYDAGKYLYKLKVNG